MENNESTNLIRSTLLSKASLKQDVFAQTSKHFLDLKKILKEMSEHFAKEVSAKDKRIKISYQDKGDF